MGIMKWDPSKGEGYVISNFRTKQLFSNQQSDYLVVEVVGDFPWHDKFQYLDDLFDKSSEVLLFSICPWGNKDRLKATLEVNAEFVYEKNRSLYGCFKSPYKISSLLKIWEEMGGFSSGPWVLAGAPSDYHSRCNVLDDIPFSLSDSPNINFVLELDEMTQAFLLIKEYKDLRNVIDCFMAEGAVKRGQA